MSLSNLIRGKSEPGRIATATPATFATHESDKGRTVASVATVTVANPLLSEEETTIRAWLAHINETDSETIADVIGQCQTDTQARDYFLEQARQVPPERDYAAKVCRRDTRAREATCAACRHFQRINHPNLGHCAQGEPEAIAGLWDATRRWCMKYEVIEHG